LARGRLSKGFPFRKLAHNQVGLGGNHISELIYSFKSYSDNKYLFHADYHKYNLYAIKFYHRSHKNDPNKYNVTTDLGEARGIFNTCLHIMSDIYERDQLASFCFVTGPVAKEIDAAYEKYLEKQTGKNAILTLEQFKEQCSREIENVKRYRI